MSEYQPEKSIPSLPSGQALRPQGVPEGDILVVDDMPVNLRLLSHMLAERGHKVRTVTNGARALEVVQMNPPDLILLDIVMPEMSGYEVCQHLKADEQSRNIPILFISALDETKDKVNAFTVGGVDYITKPFQVEEVLARVETHLALRDLQKQLLSANRELESQIEELQARNEELDAFAHSVAHDLRAPLTSIIGFAETLEKTHTTLSDEELQASLRSIARNGRKMDDIIEKLLLLAGVRQTEKVEIKPLDMVDIVTKAQKRLADMLAEYQAEVILPDIWPVALGYAPWVEEVWVTYISDAIKNSDQPPRVELSATIEADNTVRFWVRGSGPGRAKPHSGGLGQFIVRRIMEKLGRSAGVKDHIVPGQGNLFTFTLPGEKKE